jgi:hypothetical protein
MIIAMAQRVIARGTMGDNACAMAPTPPGRRRLAQADAEALIRAMAPKPTGRLASASVT